jgi:hypothetical protein
MYFKRLMPSKPVRDVVEMAQILARFGQAFGMIDILCLRMEGFGHPEASLKEGHDLLALLLYKFDIIHIFTLKEVS